MYAHFGPEALEALHEERRFRLLIRRTDERATNEWGGLSIRGTEL